MDDSMLRAIIMARAGWTGGPFQSPSAEYTAAVNAVDASERVHLREDHPARLTPAAAAAALATFVALCPAPPPDYSHCATASDIRGHPCLGRAPVMAVSVSYAVIYLAQREGFTVPEAEAVLAHLKPMDGHRSNTLLARQVLNRYATDKGIRFQDAEAVLRE